MQEKAMVADALNSINSSLKTYADMISQTENQQLRSTLQQMRNEAEQSQYELYQIAKNKNYYKSAGQASQNQINELKSTLYGSSGWAGNKDTYSSMGSSNLTGNMSNNSGVSGSSSGIGGMTGSTGMSGGSSGTLGMTASIGTSGATSQSTGMTGSTGMAGSSAGNSGLTGSQEALGLTGSSGLTANAGAFGDKGMSENSFKNVGGKSSY